MGLVAEVKQKNDQLRLQGILLQQHLRERVNAPEFSSFLVTFVVAPFLVGIIARLSPGSRSFVSHHLFHTVIPALKL